ncbi:MAG: hypothetical protein NVV59_05885 [Chitinophagaceae bacterium]|nr:hypothetical protein [Chitinophagaceae bacterium]
MSLTKSVRVPVIHFLQFLYQSTRLAFAGLILMAIIGFSCSRKPILSGTAGKNEVSATRFFNEAATMKGLQRDSLALAYLLAGNMPDFLRNLKRVSYSFLGNDKRQHEATIWVTPDYLSIGTNADWARIPLTPMAGEIIASRMDCVLPTPAMVDAIYHAADIKLEPVPLYAYRDSTPVFLHHHLIIEGQRKMASGLIAGIKKDVVRNKKSNGAQNDRVVIYGWHRLDGKPIQPVYAGHVNWYVDYSHGIRLVSKKVKLDGKWTTMDELDALTMEP